MTIIAPYQPIFYIADGTAVKFSYPFNGLSVNFVKTIVKTPDGDIATPPFAVDADSHGKLTGTITFNTAPEQNSQIMIYRESSQEQPVPFGTSSGFNAEVIENLFDKITALAQENSDQKNQTLQLSPFQRDVSLEELKTEDDQKLIAVKYDPPTGGFKITPSVFTPTIINEKVAAAAASAGNAAASAAAALGSKNAAEGAAAQASADAGQAGQSAADAYGFAQDSQASANAAQQSAEEAEQLVEEFSQSKQDKFTSGSSGVSIPTIGADSAPGSNLSKVTGIAAAASASDSNVPTEKAARTELDKKLDKVSGGDTIRAYGVSNGGGQTMFQISDSGAGGALARYRANGTLHVEDPSGSTDAASKGYVDDKAAALQENISAKTTQVMDNGTIKSEIFNEPDGGGARVTNNLTNTISFAGVNGDSSPIGAEMYCIDKDTHIGSRLLVAKNKIYYTKGNSSSSYADADEIVSLSALANAIAGKANIYVRQAQGITYGNNIQGMHIRIPAGFAYTTDWDWGTDDGQHFIRTNNDFKYVDSEGAQTYIIQNGVVLNPDYLIANPFVISTMTGSFNDEDFFYRYFDLKDLDQRIGLVSALNTSDRSSVVNAINSLKSYVDDIVEGSEVENSPYASYAEFVADPDGGGGLWPGKFAYVSFVEGDAWPSTGKWAEVAAGDTWRLDCSSAAWNPTVNQTAAININILDQSATDALKVAGNDTAQNWVQSFRNNLKSLFASISSLVSGKLDKTAIQTTEPTASSTDAQVTSAKRLWSMMGGALSSLSTTAKTIVGAINEMVSGLSSANAAIAGKVDKAGGTMTGDLILAGNPVSDNMAAPKAYVDSKTNGKLDKNTTLSIGGDPNTIVMTAYWDSANNRAVYSYYNSGGVWTAANTPAPGQPTITANQWYRLRSDRWVEQGGIAIGSSAGAIVITLPVQMIDGNYNAIGGSHTAQNNNTVYGVKITSRAQTQIVAVHNINGAYSNEAFSWIVTGIAA